MALYGNPKLTGHEKTFREDEIIVTKTDLSGKITYGNNTFYKMAGFDEGECLGQQHNLIRHPEMPRAVFLFLWTTLQANKEVFAYVNNRSKNGDNYWVFAHVSPSVDFSGKIVGYHSNRRAPNRDVVKNTIAPLYADLLQIEKSAASPKTGMENALNKVVGILEENKMGFNELMFSLGV